MRGVVKGAGGGGGWWVGSRAFGVASFGRPLRGGCFRVVVEGTTPWRGGGRAEVGGVRDGEGGVRESRDFFSSGLPRCQGRVGGFGRCDEGSEFSR